VPKITQDHIGRRAVYTGRNGIERVGEIIGVTGSPSAPFVDLRLDDSKREHFFVPEDACILIPDELLPLLGDDNGSDDDS